MFTLIDIALCAIPVAVFIYIDGPQTVSNVTIAKYRKFRALNAFVSKQHKGVFMIMYSSIVLILQALFYTLSQRINKTVVKNGDVYEVTYVIKGNKYKMAVPSSDVSPSSVFLILGDEGIDLTDTIEPYLGPYENFHGKFTTPHTFNQSMLSIETIDGVSRTFKQYDNIIV